MSMPPANDLSRAIAALRNAVKGLSADEPEAQHERAPEIQAPTPEAYHDAASAAAVSAEAPEARQAPITTPAPAGERRDKTAAARKARWKRRLADGARWIAYEIDADWIDILIASGELPEANRDNRATIAAALLDLAEEGLRARYGTVVALRASLTRLVTRSPAR